MERTDEALQTVETAFEKEPEEPLVQRSLIAQLLAMELVSRADSVIADITKRFPNNQEAWLLAGNYHIQQGDLVKGDSALARALTLGESNLADHQRARILIEQEVRRGTKQLPKINLQKP